MPVPRSVTLRFNVKTLLLALVVTVTPLVIDLFLVLDRSRTELIGLAGEYFEAAAHNAGLAVAGFLDAKIVDLRVLAAEESVQKVHASIPKQTPNEAMLLEINRDWETPKVAAIVSKMVANPLSVYLREYLTLNTSMQRIMITDAHGTVVAASHKPIKYYYGDQRWWIYAFGDGLGGRIHVADAAWDPVSMTHTVAITVPCAARDSQAVTALITGFVDIATLAPLVETVRFGETGRALLVKADGATLSAADTDLAITAKAEEMEIVGPLSKNRPLGSTVVALRGGKRLFVGYSRVPLAQRFSEIDWTILVKQDLREVSAPVSRVNTRALGSGFLAILLIGGLAVYFTTHRPQTFDPMDKVLKS